MDMESINFEYISLYSRSNTFSQWKQLNIFVRMKGSSVRNGLLWSMVGHYRSFIGADAPAAFVLPSVVLGCARR